MKKLFFLAFIFGVSATTIYAQEHGVDKSFYNSPYKNRNIGSFDQSTSLLSFGLGFPNVIVAGNGYNRVSIPTLYAKFEHGMISDEIGLGGYLAFSHSVVKYETGFGKYSENVSAFGIGLLGYYHFNKLIPVRNLDVYAGAGLAFRNVSYRNDYDNNFNNTNFNGNDADARVHPVLKLGARYYVKPSFGFYVETGYDLMSTVNLGVTFRF